MEAEPLTTISGRAIQKFFWRSIVCRFGIPHVLISDNGRQFAENTFKSWYAELGINQHITSVGHPQANGQVGNANRTILQGLKTRLELAQFNWLEELLNVLWAYRTTPRTATQETLFSLTYGVEAVVPAEIGLPSPRTQNFVASSNEEKLRYSLDMLEAKREEAAIRMAKPIYYKVSNLSITKPTELQKKDILVLVTRLEQELKVHLKHAERRMVKAVQESSYGGLEPRSRGTFPSQMDLQEHFQLGHGHILIRKWKGFLEWSPP
nr:uncharacterized protein LOC113689437 [Coffea arabica]